MTRSTLIRKKIAVSMLTSAFAILAVAPPSLLAQSSSELLNFNRDIRPILSDKCFYCHGPDEAHREAGLRLDLEEAAHEYAIVPGDLDDSELVFRITSDDHNDLMPPPDSGKALKPHEVEILKRWVSEGGKYEGHWSFHPPKKPELPQVKQEGWVRNSIDHFVLARLEQEKLAPSNEADRVQLLRRVSLDLTGLPPSPVEVDAFLNDSSDNAYEKVVDRLLASKRYGERMSLVWLDAARYADTNGYQVDRARKMWAWRDWVIDADNKNKPFDQFTVEQVAGDMLPQATLQQKIASGFNRNHRINAEGGAIPEEFRTEYVIDRVSTTGTVWMGMTFECARCHSHKYDPISQKDFYQLFAFFNNVPEKGTDGLKGNASPVLDVPIEEMQPKFAAAKERVATMKARYVHETTEIRIARKKWEEEERVKLSSSDSTPLWRIVKPLSASADNRVELEAQDDGSLLATGPVAPTSNFEIRSELAGGKFTGLRLEALTHPKLPEGRLSSSTNGNFVLSEIEVLLDSLTTDASVPIKLASAIADHSQGKYPITNAIDGNEKTGWAILGKPQSEGRKTVITFAEPIDCSEPVTITVRLKHRSQYVGHYIGCVRLAVTETDRPNFEKANAIPSDVIAILQTADADRDATQIDRIASYFRETTPMLGKLRNHLDQATKDLEQTRVAAFTQTMIMQEMSKPRKTFLLNRGQYDQPGQEVQPGIPAALGKLPEGVPNNRLGFAKFLIAPTNPLTARVTVNRYWQMYFGAGIVRTVSDFGAQGEWPSHPDLLNWLAATFVENGWDVKAMQKLIVMSATYRQDSAATPGLRGRDPENRLLARGPRFRLDAFAIRDQALAVSGLLNEKVGGPSVYPYQPAGMWADLAANANTKYPQSKGDELYRRSLYTFWKRAVAPPTMVIFDSSTRESCNVNRNSTNTPLQSLATLNDVQFIEAARFFAQRMMLEGGTTPRERLIYGWRLLLIRTPDPFELERLERAYRFHLDRFEKDNEAAQMLLSIGESRSQEGLNQDELAAYTAVANVILNLDETVTKE